MEGIVREISGRKAIQWDSVTDKEIELCGIKVSPRKYNDKVIYSAGGTLSAWVEIGDIIEVTKEEEAVIRCAIKRREHTISDNVALLQEVKEVKDILRQILVAIADKPKEKPKQNSKPTKYNPVTKRDEEYIRIKGIDCFIETDPKEIASGYRYVPCDMGEPGDPKFAIEYGKVNNIPGWE